MSDSRTRLKRTSEELARHKDRLELLVEERTKELRASREKYRQLTEDINDAIYELDRQGKILYISPAISSVLGYQPEDLLGKQITDYVHQEDLPLIERLLPQLLSGTHRQPIEYRLLESSGKPHWVRTSSRAVVGDNGPTGLRGVLVDIEDEKQVALEKETLLKRVSEHQQLEAIGTLAGGIAHDFNNLLMGIQGHTSLLSLALAPTDTSHEHVQAIEEHVRSAKKLTTQILGTAREGKYDVKPIDLNEVVTSSATMFSRTRKELQVQAETTPSPLVAEVDKQQIEQVLLNLYVNAWQAMEDGGKLRLITSPVTLDDSFCAAHNSPPGEYALIAVTDSGIGMDESISRLIFDPFFTTKEKERGTGLGLASAYGIIKNHGGFITVSSEVGHGSTFHIYLPLSTKQAITEPLVETRLLKGTETILFVDDEELIIEVGPALLTELGYQVQVAMGGVQALESLKTDGREIDLVILDMIMPGMDGGKTFDHIRELFPDIPVILSSGYAVNDQAKDIMDKGCNGFLQKPFDISHLSHKIREVLDEQQ